MKRFGRYGRFVMSEVFLEDYETAAQIFKELNAVIVRAEYLYHVKAIDYIAISNKFKLLDENEEIPFYDVVITKIDNQRIQVDVNQVK